MPDGQADTQASLVTACRRSPLLHVSGESKHDKARELVERLWRDRSGVLSTQVLQELYVSLRKARNPLPAAEARQVLSDYLRWEVIVNTGESVLEAVDLQRQATTMRRQGGRVSIVVGRTSP